MSSRKRRGCRKKTAQGVLVNLRTSAQSPLVSDPNVRYLALHGELLSLGDVLGLLLKQPEVALMTRNIDTLVCTCLSEMQP